MYYMSIDKYALHLLFEMCVFEAICEKDKSVRSISFSDHFS